MKLFRTSKGISLIEALVSITIFSIALLGTLKSQLTSIKSQSYTYFKTVAMNQANDMMERMRANKAGFLAGAYNNPASTQNTACFSTGCSTTQMAENDFYDWNQQNASHLPSGSGTITTNGDNATLTLNWNIHDSKESTTITVRLN